MQLLLVRYSKTQPAYAAGAHYIPELKVQNFAFKYKIW